MGGGLRVMAYIIVLVTSCANQKQKKHTYGIGGAMPPSPLSLSLLLPLLPPLVLVMGDERWATGDA